MTRAVVYKCDLFCYQANEEHKLITAKGHLFYCLIEKWYKMLCVPDLFSEEHMIQKHWNAVAMIRSVSMIWRTKVLSL